jgi:hypothetical protein
MEAFTVHHGLLTYMRSKEKPRKSKAFNHLFQAKAIARAKGTAWDATTGVVSFATSQLAMMAEEQDADVAEFMGAATNQASVQAMEGRPKRRAEDSAEDEDVLSVGGDDSIGSIDMIPLTNGRRARRVRRAPEAVARRVQFNPSVQRLTFLPPLEAEPGRAEGPQASREHYAPVVAQQVARPPPTPDVTRVLQERLFRRPEGDDTSFHDV